MAKITVNQFAWIFLITLLVLIGWGGYAVYRFLQNPADKILSIENEKKLGEMLEENSFGSAQGFEVVHDAYADSCILAIHNRLVSGLGKTEYSCELKLVRQPDANAFAIPGGKIFVQTGLIAFCNSPEELAAVLAHEMGHVEKRHTVNNIVKQLGLGVIMSMLTSGDASTMHELSSRLLSSYFSREDESEADDFALDLLQKSHIRPQMLGEVFARMKTTYGDTDGVMDMLNTHPALEERAHKSATFVPAENFTEEKIGIDWQKLQAAVR